VWPPDRLDTHPLTPQDMNLEVPFGPYPYTSKIPQFTPPPARLMAMPDFMLEPRPQPMGVSSRGRRRRRRR
jgi:hypothetical protein